MAEAKTASIRLVGSDAPVGNDAPVPHLLRLYPPSAGRQVYPIAPVLSVGRDGNSDVCIDSVAVSGRHAAVISDSGMVTVTDQGSRNGTFINGRRVLKGTVRENDNLRFGDTVFKLTRTPGLIEGYLPSGQRPGETMEAASQRMEHGPVGGFRIAQLERHLANLAKSAVSILLQGETGTGKEVLARFIHEKSGRKGAFVPVNCGALPPHLLEGQFFGSLRGAFSGSVREQQGYFRAAKGGTLFLDEVGDMPLEAQTTLLRAVQFKEVVPVGADRAEPVDVRIISASHRDLPKMVEQGAFRRDLFNRIAEDQTVLPPLRERKEDLYQLCTALLRRHGRPELILSTLFYLGLLEHPFPGNIRELESIIKRALPAVPPGQRELTPAQLPDHLRKALVGYGSPDYQRPKSADDEPEQRITVDAPVGLEQGPTADQPARAAATEKPVPDGYPTRETVVGMMQYYRGNVTASAKAFGRSRTWFVAVLEFYGLDRHGKAAAGGDETP